MSPTADVRLAIRTGRPGWRLCRRPGYCREGSIAHEVISGYDYRIIERLRDFDGLLWHFQHASATDLLMARRVLTAAEHMGLVVFRNQKTCWHFDDKIAQKYLLEAVGAPLVPTYVVYNLSEARKWLKQAHYPLVWKLRRGAGSTNVRLVEDYGQAMALCRRAFGRGFNPGMRYFSDAATKVRNVRDWRASREKLRRMPRMYWKRRVARRLTPRETGYALFQEFVPGNTTDTRITVVGNRAWGFVRNVRQDDFRASGSGSIDYDRSKIRSGCVRTPFAIAEALQSQSTAIDFLIDREGNPLMTEISCAYLPEVVYAAGGYWDRDLQWHAEPTRPEHAVVQDLVAAIIACKRGDRVTEPPDSDTAAAD